MYENMQTGVVYPVDAVLTIATRILAVMERVIEGEMPDDALYARLFGSKEGLVQQLERVCDIVSQAREIEVTRQQRTGRVMDEDERALIRHYVVQLAKQYAQEDAQAAAPNAGDA